MYIGDYIRLSHRKQSEKDKIKFKEILQQYKKPLFTCTWCNSTQPLTHLQQLKSHGKVFEHFQQVHCNLLVLKWLKGKTKSSLLEIYLCLHDWHGFSDWNFTTSTPKTVASLYARTGVSLSAISFNFLPMCKTSFSLSAILWAWRKCLTSFAWGIPYSITAAT